MKNNLFFFKGFIKKVIFGHKILGLLLWLLLALWLPRPFHGPAVVM